jgi:Mg-chelatase subunit ChlD/tetratricopeptide (TPR) repeat protein
MELAYKTAEPALATKRADSKNSVMSQDAGNFLDAIREESARTNVGLITDLSDPSRKATEGFGRTGTGATYAENGWTNGASQQVDEIYRRRYGGVAWTDNAHSKQGGVGLADGSVEQLSRSKLQEGLRNNSENKPAEKIPVIDPATGLPVPGDYASGAIDPATGLSIPAEVAESKEVPAMGNARTWTGAAGTDEFFTELELSKGTASQAVSGGGGTGGGGGAGRDGRVIVSGQVPVRALREPALAPAQTTPPASMPVDGEKLAELAQKGKDASGSNIYLGKELAKADVKFGTWSLETAQAAAQPGGTKNEEEILKQVGELADRGTIAGRAASPGLGFSLLGPKETPPTSGVPIDSQGVPLLGDLPMLGKAFKGGETKPDQARGEAESAPGDLALARGTKATRERDATLLFEMGRLDEAEALFKQAAKEDPNNRATDYYLNLIKDSRYRRTLNGKELVTRQAMVDIEKDWLNPPSAEIRPSATNVLSWPDVSSTPQFPSNVYGSQNVYGSHVVGYVNVPISVATNMAPVAGASTISDSFAKRLKDTSNGTVQYDRYSHYRLLEQLGSEGDKETKLALNYSDVQDDDRKAVGKSSAAETKETEISVPSELVSEVIPIKYAKASEIASALNSLSSARGGGATVGGGTTTRSLTGTRATGGFGRTGTGANYGSPSSPFGTQPPWMTTPQANGNPAAGNSFSDRLRGIINRAANAGEIVVFGQTKMIPDERANSLLLYASRDDMKTIKDIIAKLDADLAPVTDPKVAAKPVTTPLIPQPEVQTRENAFSTFSLNVSDVAFKLAGASLEKGQMPEPANIRSEEFINAFDYRDPEAPAGVPVAFAWERARYPYAQNRDLLRFSIKTAAQGRQAGRPLNIVLLMDNSGSMERADRVAIIREALKVLASQLQPQDKLSVITFARTAQLRVDGVAGNHAAQVAEDIGGLTPEGGTNLEEAMNLAYQTALRHYLANGINRVVLLTDGAANLGNVEPDSLKQKVEANRKQGVALDCFGIGWEGFNDDLLETLSRNGDGRYGFINSPEEAATEFAGQLAGALNVAASDVKVQVEFNPARVTAYRQIGYAKHQLTKEQFRDNTVDAAEIAAQEAGNALYVIEVNPTGQGPLGTVRVRFKVPGTSDYREHEWTVPFNGNAVALAQAPPAMRLAATASAFSEWLASSPYATEVTPDTLLSYLGGVPEVYGADGRPKKLEWMIRQAKSLSGK